MKGRTTNVPYGLEITPSNTYRLQYRFINGIHYDDLYLQQELNILAKYIKPTDICLQTLFRTSTGVLLKYCKELYVVFWDRKAYPYINEL